MKISVVAVSVKNQGYDSGSAYVFRYDGARWVREQKLTYPEGSTYDHFGRSVAISRDVLVKGGDYGKEGVVGWEFVESYGGRVVVAPLVRGKSSTATIEKLKTLQAETQ